jgi:predicted nucleic acid-binding protein
MAADDAVFIDTNVLVYAKVAKAPLHALAQERLRHLDEQGVELWVARQTLREYLSAMTKPDSFTEPIPIPSLVDDIRYFADRFRVAEDGSHVTERLLQLLMHVPAGGKQIHDANIVATMLAYGISRLLTHNVTDFRRYGRLIEVLPLVQP